MLSGCLFLRPVIDYLQKSTHSVIGGSISICQSNALSSPLCWSSSPTKVQSISRIAILISHRLPLESTSCQTTVSARSLAESFCRNILVKESILCSSRFISSSSRRRWGIVIEPPTASPILKASKNSGSALPPSFALELFFARDYHPAQTF